MSLFTRLLQGTIRSLTPNEDRFFDMLTDTAQTLEKAVDALGSIPGTTPDSWATVVGEVAALESRCESKVLELLKELRGTFITPVDKEDLRAMARGIQKSIRKLNGAAVLISIHGMKDLPTNTAAILEQVKAATKLIVTDVSGLRLHLKKGTDLDSVPAVREIQCKVDKLYGEAVAGYYRTSTEPIALHVAETFLTELRETAQEIENLAADIQLTTIGNA